MNAETPTVNIALCGYYGKHNLGDDLVADSLKNRLTRPGTIVTLYSDDNTDDIKNGLDCGYLQSDIIVFGGGTIVTPDFWVFQKHRLDQLIESGKPVTFLNVTITTEMTSNSDFVQSLKRLNANWWVRDKQSADLLLGVDIQAKHMPDISCTLDIKNKQSNNKKLTVFLNHNTFVALTRAHDSKNYIRATHVINEISRFLDSFKQNGWSINLLAAQTSRDMDDRLPSIIAFHSLKTRSGCNWQSDHMHWKEQLNEILDSDLVISMRYHTTLLSYISGTPFIDITHHDKNKFFLIENQLEKHSCDYWGVSLEMLQACCEQANHMTRFSDTVEEAQQRWHEFDLFWANEIAKKQEEH